MITVQMGVDQAIQRTTLKLILNQGQGLIRMCGVSAVNQGGLVIVDEQHIVGRQPATFKKIKPRVLCVSLHFQILI